VCARRGGLVLGAAALVAAAPPSALAATFETPSGNIICATGRQALRGAVSCTVLSEADSRGQTVWSMRRRGRANVFRSTTNAPIENPILGYGRTYRGFGVRCTSRKRGLTCRNRSRHGFFLSRDRKRVF
jgi:hypothetical protein